MTTAQQYNEAVAAVFELQRRILELTARNAKLEAVREAAIDLRADASIYDDVISRGLVKTLDDRLADAVENDETGKQIEAQIAEIERGQVVSHKTLSLELDVELQENDVSP